MNPILKNYRAIFSEIEVSAKFTLASYFLANLVLGACDAAALYFLATLIKEATSDLSSTLEVRRLLVVLVLFLVKSIGNSVVQFLLIRSMAKQEVDLGQRNLIEFLRQYRSKDKDKKESNIITLVDTSPTIATQVIMQLGVLIVGDILTCIFIIGIMTAVSPIVSAISISYFSIVVLVQHKILISFTNKFVNTVLEQREKIYNKLADISKMTKTLRLMPSKSLDFHIRNERKVLSQIRSKMIYLQSLPRYFIESILTLGILFVSGLAFLLLDNAIAKSGTIIFLAVVFRIVPLINGIQGMVLRVVSAMPEAKLSINDEIKLSDNSKFIIVPQKSNTIYSLNGISLIHDGSEHRILNEIYLEFKRNRLYVIAGCSGSGKSSLIDLLINEIDATRGQIISYLAGDDVLTYLSAEPMIFDATVGENIAIEWDIHSIDVARVDQLLGIVGLIESGVKNSDNIARLSSGELQRAMVARALYRDPTVLLLDEPTANLDRRTERVIIDLLTDIKNNAMVIAVTHSHDLLRAADEIIFLKSNGSAISGNFDILQRNDLEFQSFIAGENSIP
jgi:ABC-type transport system involved in cytochrome bd biosynthesis fused ATPase/permease subunit